MTASPIPRDRAGGFTDGYGRARSCGMPRRRVGVIRWPGGGAPCRGTTSSASTVALRVPVERPGGKTASALFTPHVPGYVTNDSGHLPTAGPPWILMTCPEQMEVFVMKPLPLWIAVPMMLLGAGMLIAGIGATALWIAVIAVGIAMVAVGRAKPGAAGRK
jgi:hypothetical protein